MTSNSHVEQCEGQFANDSNIEINITDINSQDLNDRVHGEYVFERMIMRICEVKPTEHREGTTRVTTFRKLRLQDNHRSDIYLTLWGVTVNIPEQLGMVKGSWISVRNFKANSYNGTVGEGFN